MLIKKRHAFYALSALVLLAALALFYSALNDNVSLPEPGSPASLAAIFLVGLFTSLHCIGMCGGFCAAAAGSRNGVPLYLASKTFSYTAIGALLGALGSAFSISSEARAGLAVFAGAFMVLYALNALGFKPARMVYGMLPRLPVGGGHAGPVAAGLLNGFMPCGPLQAMQVYALSTADPVQGGLVMLAFGIGTLPLMAGFGFIATSLSASRKSIVFKASAFIVLALGLALLVNSTSSLQFGEQQAPEAAPLEQPGPCQMPAGVDFQTIRSELYGYGYSPRNLNVSAGKPVQWIIDVKELTGCNNAVKIPEFGLLQSLHYGENIVELPAMGHGTVEYGCWMWMLRGRIIVG